MSHLYYIPAHRKGSHLTPSQIEFALEEITKFESSISGSRRNSGLTHFMADLADRLGCSRSTLYSLKKAASIQVLDRYCAPVNELSVPAAIAKRGHRSRGLASNASKRNKASEFIEAVCSYVAASKLTSVDEAVHFLNSQRPDLPSVSTSTMYSYIHRGLVDLKPIDLPRMVRLRKKPDRFKTYIPKRQKGKSIDLRPSSVDSRMEFGDWEGDLVTGPRDGQNGAYLTLIERKTRFYLMLPITKKSSKQVYMRINDLERYYGTEDFKKIFRSITFDNGNEFSRYKDIERKPGSKLKRTSVFFAHPYRSGERGSNENCNGLLRRLVPKGTRIEKIPKERSRDFNRQINDKHRKILGYHSASEAFLQELQSLGISQTSLFYE